MHYFAYIDPGTGSLFIQAVFGVALAGGVIFRNLIRKFFDRLKLAITRQTTDESE